MSEKIILGNIITVDESKPKAEAVAIRDGIIVKVGTEAEARAAVSPSAEVMDYKGQWVYPGFLESHTHGMLAGYRALDQANLFTVNPTDYDKYADIMRQFIKDNPDKEFYLAAGWEEDGTSLDHTYLDAICPDKPFIMNTAGGHSCLLNKKAMEKYGFDDNSSVEKFGTDLVHVDDNGHPNGYLCEEPCLKLIETLPKTVAEIKAHLLKWQEIAFSQGITAVGDAGCELMARDTVEAYKELQDEGKLSMRTYAYLMVDDNTEDPTAFVEQTAKKASEINGEYFRIIGIKGFLDGVIEAHTGWLIDDYTDQPGYHGIERFNDPDKMVELLVEASKKGLSVHVHSIGDGSTRFMLDCIEKAQEITKDKDQRNLMAHLQLVSNKDIQRMADTNTVAVVAPLWTPIVPGETDQEIAYIGKERSDNTYPIRSFVDKGAKIAFHSDYPISRDIDISESIFRAKTRGLLEFGEDYFKKSQRNLKEAIDSMESLKAVTINVAYAWKQEDRMGSISDGKIANFTVVDTDFLDGDIMSFSKAKILATIVDGNVVYKNKN